MEEHRLPQPWLDLQLDDVHVGLGSWPSTVGVKDSGFSGWRSRFFLMGLLMGLVRDMIMMDFMGFQWDLVGFQRDYNPLDGLYPLAIEQFANWNMAI